MDVRNNVFLQFIHKLEFFFQKIKEKKAEANKNLQDLVSKKVMYREVEREMGEVEVGSDNHARRA